MGKLAMMSVLVFLTGAMIPITFATASADEDDRLTEENHETRVLGEKLTRSRITCMNECILLLNCRALLLSNPTFAQMRRCVLLSGTSDNSLHSVRRNHKLYERLDNYHHKDRSGVIFHKFSVVNKDMKKLEAPTPQPNPGPERPPSPKEKPPQQCSCGNVPRVFRSSEDGILLFLFNALDAGYRTFSLHYNTLKEVSLHLPSQLQTLLIWSKQCRLLYKLFPYVDGGLVSICLDGSQRKKVSRRIMGAVALDRVRGLVVYTSRKKNQQTASGHRCIGMIKADGADESRVKCFTSSLNTIAVDAKQKLAFSVYQRRSIISINYLSREPRTEFIARVQRGHIKVLNFVIVQYKPALVWLNEDTHAISLMKITGSNKILTLNDCMYTVVRGFNDKMYALCEDKIIAHSTRLTSKVDVKIPKEARKTRRIRFAIG